MKRTMVAVVFSMLTVGLAAVVLALVYSPTASPRRIVGYLVAMLTVGVVVANVWAAVRVR